jgi:hypothetical protein
MAKVGYVTSTHNMPLLADKNQGQVMGTMSWNHMEIQGAYSPLKNLGLIGNFYAGISNATSFEYGLGTYKTFKSKYLFEIYALRIDTDIQKRHVTEDGGEVLNSRYKGYSVQIDLGLFVKKDEKAKRPILSFAIGAKLSDVVFSEFEYAKYPYWTTDSSSPYGPHTSKFLESNRHQFLAASFTMRFQKKRCRLLMQYSNHMSLSGLPPSQDFPPYYKRSWLTIGFEWAIGGNKNSKIPPKEKIERK